MAKCPICECKKCDELIIDLLICNECSHIFKKEPYNHDVYCIHNIHTMTNPVLDVRLFLEGLTKDKMEFKFPSLMFHTLDLKPNDFYRHKFNHYFNQMSLMIFLKRCGLIPIKQTNTKEGRTSYTVLETEVEK